jgi:hypothetical protein
LVRAVARILHRRGDPKHASPAAWSAERRGQQSL